MHETLADLLVSSFQTDTTMRNSSDSAVDWPQGKMKNMERFKQEIAIMKMMDSLGGNEGTEGFRMAAFDVVPRASRPQVAAAALPKPKALKPSHVRQRRMAKPHRPLALKPCAGPSEHHQTL